MVSLIYELQSSCSIYNIYDILSWTEKRSVQWKHYPFVARRDNLDLGLPPKVWDVELKMPADFESVSKKIQMPRSEVLTSAS